MSYPKPYIEYLIQFHATRDYFECHELLEEYWKEQPDDHLSQLWVACIQIAVGQYHERRGNLRGAQLMYQSALLKLAHHRANQIGLEHEALVRLLELRYEACQGSGAYEDLNLPIMDKQLLEQCMAEVKERSLVWHQSSQGLSEEIIHRHSRRDRSDVISARLAALTTRQRQRADEEH